MFVLVFAPQGFWYFILVISLIVLICVKSFPIPSQIPLWFVFHCTYNIRPFHSLESCKGKPFSVWIVCLFMLILEIKKREDKRRGQNGKANDLRDPRALAGSESTRKRKLAATCLCLCGASGFQVSVLARVRKIAWGLDLLPCKLQLRRESLLSHLTIMGIKCLEIQGWNEGESFWKGR